LIVIAPPLVQGQDDASDLSAGWGHPGVGVLAPRLRPWRDTSPVALDWIPDPILVRLYPVVPRISAAPPSAFQQLVRAAGIVFSGRVTSVGSTKPSAGPDRAATAITFKVEHAIRGTFSNQILTIHEWAGLWNRGERYHTGEHVFLFLYSPSKLGLSSPVAGALGRFPMDSEGNIILSPQHIAILAADPVLRGKTLLSYAEFAAAVQQTRLR
jgi:hypothetical protein